MKVIFLDFDGVVNSEEYSRLRRIAGHGEPGSFLYRESDEIDPIAVARLNRIIEATGAKVCISSTWRILHKIGELAGFLRTAGFAGEVIGMTPRQSGPSPRRGNEIAQWIESHNARPMRHGSVEAFVILDDDADMEHLIDHLVQTDGSAGLEDHHVERAIAMLGRLG